MTDQSHFDGPRPIANVHRRQGESLHDRSGALKQDVSVAAGERVVAHELTQFRQTVAVAAGRIEFNHLPGSHAPHCAAASHREHTHEFALNDQTDPFVVVHAETHQPRHSQTQQACTFLS